MFLEYKFSFLILLALVFIIVSLINRQDDIDKPKETSSNGCEGLELHFESIKVATNEMMLNTKDISKNTSSTAKMMNNTLVRSEEIEYIVKKLGDSSKEIDEILQVVANITHQTNLLALNASIEAARAGDAGKGFVVVANEVKELSKQTKIATKEIAEKIEAIQNEIKEAQNAMSTNTKSLREINKLTQEVAVSIEKQTAYNQEIVKSIEDANHALRV